MVFFLICPNYKLFEVKSSALPYPFTLRPLQPEIHRSVSAALCPGCALRGGDPVALLWGGCST